MKLLQCVLIMLNLLIVIGHQQFKHRTLKMLAKEDNTMETVKHLTARRFVPKTYNLVRNILKNSNIKNALERNITVKKAGQNVETKFKENYDKITIMDEDEKLSLDRKSEHPTRRFWSNILNFVKNMQGFFHKGGGGGGKNHGNNLKFASIDSKISGKVNGKINMIIDQRSSKN